MKKTLAVGLLVVAMVAVRTSGQTALNPTVKVLPRPQSPVPAECADGVTATQTPVAPEVPEPQLQPPPIPAPSSVPPSNELRTLLRRAQVAAAGEDYAEFKASVADVRRALASYPPGGERTAANEALQVYADIARVWDYAMASPTGSFFDNTVQGGSLLNAMKRYPDYGRALAAETVTVGGKTLYPTRETRRFLAQESGRRLGRLGVSVPPTASTMNRIERPTHAAEPPVKQASPAPPKKQTRPAAEPKTAAVAAAPKPHAAKHMPSSTAKASPPKSTAPRIESTPVPNVKPANPPPAKIAATPAAAPTKQPAPSTKTAASSSAITETQIVAAPIVATPRPPATTSVASSTKAPTATAGTPVPTATVATTSSSTTAPASATTATTTTTPSATTAPTETSETATAGTATSGTAVPAEKQNGNMNLILAIVLILVGVGVLIVLFRTSD